MEENRAEWLPHLSSEIVSSIQGSYLDAYVLALEGWRRGLTLKWHVKESEKFPEMRTWLVHNPGQLFSLSSDEKAHYFFRSRGDKVSNNAVDIGWDKDRTKEILQFKNIKMPSGKKFKEDESNEMIIRYTAKLGFPVVLKPTDGSFGRGVISNIKTIDELENSLEYVRKKLNYRDILIEKYIPGKEYRLYIVDYKVVGAMNRVPANITGDGVHTIRSLIKRKNEERSQNPRLVSCPIIVTKEIEKFIENQGYSLNEILEKDKLMYLTNKTNISLGGDPIDVFDELPSYVKDKAIQALHAIPGFTHGAVDLIVHQDTSEVYVIELSSTANLGGLLFPIKGKSRDIPKEIIDYYFPETKRDNNTIANVYFDYNEVLLPLKERTGFATKVKPLEYKNLYSKKYLLKGEVQNFRFHQWIKSEATERLLNGYVINKNNREVIIFVAGPIKDVVDKFRDIFLLKEEYTIEEIKEEKLNESIKIGFEIQDEKKHLLKKFNELQLEIFQSNNDLKSLEKKYNDILNSRLWKMTIPLRKFTGALKRVYNSFKKR